MNSIPANVICENSGYADMKMPYYPFQATIDVTGALQTTQHGRRMLLLIGYSKCGKTTILKQFSAQDPVHILYFDHFSICGRSAFLAEIGQRFSIPLKQRDAEIEKLIEGMKHHTNVMLIFDDVQMSDPQSTLDKLDYLCRIHRECQIPIVICGTPQLYNKLYNGKNVADFATIITSFDEHRMAGIQKKEVAGYLKSLAESERVEFTREAENLLAAIAKKEVIGGLGAMLTMVGRAIPAVRALYYHTQNGKLPTTTECYAAALAANQQPFAEHDGYILPPTPEPVTIDEALVRFLLAKYKIACKEGGIPA